MCSCSLFFSLPLIFTLVAASISPLSHRRYKIFMVFFLRNWSPLVFISRSSSFSVIHVNVDIEIKSKERMDFCCCSFGVFTWENSHRREFHTGMTFWFRFAFTWWLGHLPSRYLKVHSMLIKYTCDSKSQTSRMRCPFQSIPADRFHTETGGRFAFTWYRCEISYRSEKSRPGKGTGVTRAGMTFCGGIM